MLADLQSQDALSLSLLLPPQGVVGPDSAGRGGGGLQAAVAVTLGRQQQVHLVVHSEGLTSSSSSTRRLLPLPLPPPPEPEPHHGVEDGGEEAGEGEGGTTDDAQADPDGVQLVLRHLPGTLVLELRHLAGADAQGLHGVDGPGLLAGRVAEVRKC